MGYKGTCRNDRAAESFPSVLAGMLPEVVVEGSLSAVEGLAVVARAQPFEAHRSRLRPAPLRISLRSAVIPARIAGIQVPGMADRPTSL
jgi:hypothetical protein